MPIAPTCNVYHLGTVEYLRAWDLQKELVQRAADGLQPNTLLLLEHQPVYTLGRRGTRDQVLLSASQLSERGIALSESDRGGEVTYHGPGQLVAYPVLDLKEWGGPVKYVRTLEQVIVKTLANFGIVAGLVEGLTGVWVEGGKARLERSRKIAAIGVRISRGICHHGLALNVNTDLSYFQHIVPCGMEDGEVTSMEGLLGNPVDMDTVAYSLVYHLGVEMGLRMVEAKTLPEDLSTPLPSGRGS